VQQPKQEKGILAKILTCLQFIPNTQKIPQQAKRATTMIKAMYSPINAEFSLKAVAS
jgi:hypothetical protein